MKDLLEVIQILMKYANDDRNPTHCEHDTLYFCAGIEEDMVSKEDIKRLDELGVFWSDNSFVSYRFGSC